MELIGVIFLFVMVIICGIMALGGGCYLIYESWIDLRDGITLSWMFLGLGVIATLFGLMLVLLPILSLIFPEMAQEVPQNGGKTW